MWNNNASNQHGNFQQRSFKSGYQDDGYIAFSSGGQPQQYLPTLCVNQADRDQLMSIDYPELGVYNNTNYMPNQVISRPESPIQYTPPLAQSSTDSQSTARTTILNAEAADLKAKLMKNKERTNSGTSHSIGLGSNRAPMSEGTNFMRSSPKAPGSAVSSEVLPVGSSERISALRVSDDDLNALFSEATAATDAKIQNEISPSSSSRLAHHLSNVLGSSPKAKLSVLNSFDQVGEQKLKSSNCERKQKKTTTDKHVSNSSDVSDEGEIREEEISETVIPSPKTSNESHPKPQLLPTEQCLLKSYNQDAGRKSGVSDGCNKPPQQLSRSPPMGPKRKLSHSRDERYDDAEEKLDQNSHENYKPSHRYGRKPESEPRAYKSLDSRDINESQRKHEANYDKKKEEPITVKPKPFTLEDLLVLDEDLRDWLHITEYHNVEKRNKILNRRRALAALDAQKAKILEEMEMEEGNGPRTMHLTPAAMGPPLIPIKIASPASYTPAPPLSSKTVDASSLTTTCRSPFINSTQESKSKRNFSDYGDSHDESDKGRTNKFSRIEERGRTFNVKSEPDTDNRGRLSPYRRSPSPGLDDFRLDEGQGRGRGAGRGRGIGRRFYDREPESSLGYQTHEKKNSARSFSDSDEYQSRGEGRDRPYVERGGYRGRAYDPNHHLKKSAGRGRASLSQPELESRPEQSSLLSYGNRIANMNPYRDRKGIHKGGKGETRYFIVKSFNEENVLRCIQDSIWTTQIHNGEIFQKAFETCKNVILVFSINQSHAFQGYARMENTPGSEGIPQWHGNINWESSGAFRVRWITIAVTRFSRVGHLKNSFNDNMPVLVAKDGQEVEEWCGSELLKLIDDEADGRGTERRYRDPTTETWD